MDHYAMALTDLTNVVKQHLDEGAAPEDIIMALDSIRFTIMMQRWETAKAFNTLFLQGQKPPGDDELVKR